MKFVLNYGAAMFVAEAPDDMTVAQLVKQNDRIVADWGDGGLSSLENVQLSPSSTPDLVFTHDDVRKTYGDVACRIIPKRELIGGRDD